MILSKLFILLGNSWSRISFVCQLMSRLFQLHFPRLSAKSLLEKSFRCNTKNKSSFTQLILKCESDNGGFFSSNFQSLNNFLKGVFGIFSHLKFLEFNNDFPSYFEDFVLEIWPSNNVYSFHIQSNLISLKRIFGLKSCHKN